jgi:hypothetical protein
VPSSGARTCTNRILRDYLVAALRCSPHPLTTTQLRHGAPLVAVQGSARPLPPAQETIYRLLCSLQGQGTVATADSAAYTRAWIATPSAAADHEIAALDTLFDAPSAATSHRHPRIDSCQRRR